MAVCQKTDWKRLQKKGFRYEANQKMVLFLMRCLPVIFPWHLGIYGQAGKGIKVGGFKDDPCNKFHYPGKSADIYLLASEETDLKLGDALFEMFYSYPDMLGVEQVIWNSQLWLASKDMPGSPRAFTPTAELPDHHDHIHVTFAEEDAVKWGSSFLLCRLGAVRSQVFGGD